MSRLTPAFPEPARTQPTGRAQQTVAWTGPGGSPVPVLVVDDTESKRVALRAVLSAVGYDIVEADSGLAALRAILKQDFAVILLDVRMPGMDGFETAGLIRQRRANEATPIIFVTGNTSDEFSMRDRYAQGAVDFIFSPFEPDELRAKVFALAHLYVRAAELAAHASIAQASADQLRLLTDAAPIGIFQTDAHGHYTYTNPQWSLITGVPAEAARERPWTIILGTQEHADLIADPADAASARAEFCHRFEISGQHDEPRVVMLTSRPVFTDAGELAGWVGTLADVTSEVAADLAMSHARFALEELNVQLTVVARQDPLTGLSNRRALREDLDNLEARTRRYGHRYCLAILDIDYFKSFNDTYGHQAGDEALQTVAMHLNEQIRAGDGLYRYGGEEFLCVFPEQSMADAIRAVERMRDGVASLAIPHLGSPCQVLTISGGLAMLDPDDPRAASAVLKEADEALYRAKQSGRNRVEPPHPLPEVLLAESAHLCDERSR